MRKIFKYNDEFFYVLLITIVFLCYGIDAMNTEFNIYAKIYDVLDNLTFLILLLICWGVSDIKKFLVQRILVTLILLAGLNLVNSIFVLSKDNYYTIFFYLLLINILYSVYIKWKS